MKLYTLQEYRPTYSDEETIFAFRKFLPSTPKPQFVTVHDSKVKTEDFSDTDSLSCSICV